MFKFFKKKSEVDKLNEKYQSLQSEAYRLSTSDRTASDEKYAEAQAVLDQIDSLEKKQ